jgi:hypothetical protein
MTTTTTTKITPSAAAETERIVTAFFTLIPGSYNWVVRHGRWHHSRNFTLRRN